MSDVQAKDHNEKNSSTRINGWVILTIFLTSFAVSLSVFVVIFSGVQPPPDPSLITLSPMKVSINGDKYDIEGGKYVIDSGVAIKYQGRDFRIVMTYRGKLTNPGTFQIGPDGMYVMFESKGKVYNLLEGTVSFSQPDRFAIQGKSLVAGAKETEYFWLDVIILEQPKATPTPVPLQKFDFHV